MWSGLETILSIVLMATISSVILSSFRKRSRIRLQLPCLRGGHYHLVEMKPASHLLLCSINQASSILQGPGPLCVRLNLRVFSRFRILQISYFCQSTAPRAQKWGWWLGSGWKALIFWESVMDSNLRMWKLVCVYSDLRLSWSLAQVSHGNVCRYFSLASNSLKIRGYIITYIYSAPCK